MQVRAGQPLAGIVRVTARVEERLAGEQVIDLAAHGRLGDAVEVAEVFMSALHLAGHPELLLDDPGRPEAQLQLSHLGEHAGLVGAGDDHQAVQRRVGPERPAGRRAGARHGIAETGRPGDEAGLERRVRDVLDAGNPQGFQALEREANVHPDEVELDRRARLLLQPEEQLPLVDLPRRRELGRQLLECRLEGRNQGDVESHEGLEILLETNEHIALDLVEVKLGFAQGAVEGHGILLQFQRRSVARTPAPGLILEAIACPTRNGHVRDALTKSAKPQLQHLAICNTSGVCIKSPEPLDGPLQVLAASASKRAR